MLVSLLGTLPLQRIVGNNFFTCFGTIRKNENVHIEKFLHKFIQTLYIHEMNKVLELPKHFRDHLMVVFEGSLQQLVLVLFKTGRHSLTFESALFPFPTKIEFVTSCLVFSELFLGR